MFLKKCIWKRSLWPVLFNQEKQLQSYCKTAPYITIITTPSAANHHLLANATIPYFCFIISNQKKAIGNKIYFAIRSRAHKYNAKMASLQPQTENQLKQNRFSR